ncbi:MAG: uracil phosphoribosyltransferase [Candidatus Kariarchaeaceae archaeon]|jgi:uracil phosphoribosyltransferase
MLVKFRQSLLLEQAVSIIRDKNTDSAKFRKYLERIGSYLSFEAAKTFEAEEISVETPLATASSLRIKQEIVILSILRAALPMTNAVFNQFEGASLGIVSASRGNMIATDGREFEIESNYSKVPDIENKIVIIVDPMLATGSTIKFLLQSIEDSEQNPTKIVVFCAIASKFGIDQLEKNHPNVEIFAAAVDEILNEKGYIVPGLGDAGDRAFNTPHE